MISPRQFIRETGFRPSRPLGQNFLVHEDSARKIAKFSGAQSGEFVLEIGPGLGALTRALGEIGCNVTAIEKDARLVEFLESEFQDAPWLTLHHGDALTLTPEDPRLPNAKRFHVVSNLPYSVSTPILEKLVSFIDRVESMTLLVQEEVVDRIAAAPGSKDYGRLSIWMQTLLSTERGPRIPKGSFYPEPKVESRLVKLTPLAQPLIAADKREAFLSFVALIFQHRRKTIRNAMKDAGIQVPESLTNDPRRPETFAIEELLELFLSGS